MNPRIANLIAIEIGILVGLMSWLTYSRFPSSEPRTTAEMRERSAAPVKAVAPVNSIAPAFAASNQPPSTAEYSAEREQARLMAERAASLQSYYRAVARASYTTSGVETGSNPVDSPTYGEVNPEPAAIEDEYLAPPPTVFYYAPAAVQNVLFANRHRFRNRRQSPLLPGRIGTTTPQCLERGNLHRNDRVVSPNPVPPPPRGTVSQPWVIAGQQKRGAVPPSRGAGQNSFSVP